MPTLFEMGEGISFSHHELAFIRNDGVIDVWCYGYQPTTNDIAAKVSYRGGRGNSPYTHVVQKIGELFEVYDLKTLQPLNRWSSEYTIGLPVAAHADVDAAIMQALLTC